jgi:hypothetical protein
MASPTSPGMTAEGKNIRKTCAKKINNFSRYVTPKNDISPDDFATFIKFFGIFACYIFKNRLTFSPRRTWTRCPGVHFGSGIF